LVVFKKNIIGVQSYKNRFSSFGKRFKFHHNSQFAIISTNEVISEIVHLGMIKNTIKKILKNKKKIRRIGKYKRRKKRVFKLKNIRIKGIIGRIGKGKRRSKTRRL
jgi:hypothetical protein